MNQKHKHAEVINAAADGKDVQWYSNGWVTKQGHDALASWTWPDDQKFRIKPERKYPETRMTFEELRGVFFAVGEGCNPALFRLANYAIRRAIQDGDVVLPEGKE